MPKYDGIRARNPVWIAYLGPTTNQGMQGSSGPEPLPLTSSSWVFEGGRGVFAR